MLLSLTSLAAVMLSTSAGWITSGMEGPPIHPGNASVTPQDPSTLVLALIGAGTLAVYVMVRRRPTRTVALWTRRLGDQSASLDLADGEEQKQSRGAA